MARQHFNRHYLHNLMHVHGLTETQLAFELEMSQSTISHWLRGRSKPSKENLAKLADRFNLPMERFAVAHDKSDSEARLRDMLFDLQVSGRQRDVIYALDAHERLYGKIEVDRDEAIAAVVDWRQPRSVCFRELNGVLEVANYTGRYTPYRQRANADR